MTQALEGLSRREYIAIHLPEPKEEYIQQQMELDKLRNPHNDSYKPRRRGRLEVICDLRFAYADEMLNAAKRERTSAD